MAALGLISNKIEMWDWSSNASSYKFGSNTGLGSYIIFLKDGRLAGQSNVSTVNVWDVSSGNVDIILDSKAYAVEELYNGWLATGGADQTLKIWDISSTGSLVNSIFLDSAIFFIKQLRITNYIATGHGNGSLLIHDVTNNFTLYKSLIGHTTAIRAIEELPNGNILTCSGDSTVKLWNITNSNFLSSINPFGYQIYCLKLISSDTILVGGLKSSLYVLKIIDTNKLVVNTSFPLLGSATISYSIQVTKTDLVIISNSLKILAFYNRTNMNLINSYKSSDSVNSLAISGNLLFFVC